MQKTTTSAEFTLESFASLEDKFHEGLSTGLCRGKFEEVSQFFLFERRKHSRSEIKGIDRLLN